MGAFEYQALDQKGRTKKGVTTGDTARQVRQILRDQGLMPLEVSEVGEEKVERKKKGTKSGQTDQGGASPGSRSRRKLKTMELAVTTRQFATLLGSGLTIEESMTGLIEQSEGQRIKSILSGVRSSVMEGSSLADSLKLFPRSFPELYTASVSAGEQTGRLGEVLERLADYTEARQGLQQRIGVALIYPIILITVALLIVAGLVTYVVPQVVKVFEDSGQALPFLTTMIIGLSDFLRAYGLYIIGALVVAFVVAGIIFKQEGPKYILHGFFLKMPGISRLSRSINTSRMARTLAIMVGSGVPLLSALKAASEVITNRVMRRSLEKAALEVGEGASLNKALSRTKRFPPLLNQMVASGESSGRLAQMLEKAAIALERELESRLAVLVGLFEPVMILVMGAVILIIVLAILLPIFDLNTLVG